MKLSGITLPISYEESKGFALVFAPALAARLSELHAAHGSSNCVPVPLPLTDGRLMLGADVLTEVKPGGLLAAMWGAADQAVLGAAVEVIAWDEAVAMLPQPEPMAWGM